METERKKKINIFPPPLFFQSQHILRRKNLKRNVAKKKIVQLQNM